MKTRSKSVPKISNFEILRKAPPALQLFQDKISSRVYGEKPVFPKLNLLLVDKPPLMHLHKQRSFDQITQSSPITRVKKLQEARFYRKENDTFRIKTNQSIQSGVSNLSRLDKSNEIVNHAQQLLFKEQENKEEISKANHIYSGKVIESLRGINRKLSLAGIPKLTLIKKHRKRSKNLSRILSVKN